MPPSHPSSSRLLGHLSGLLPAPLLDVKVSLCSHFTTAIFFFFAFRPSLHLLASSSSFRSFLLFFFLLSCLPLSIRFNLNWELRAQDGASGSEPFTCLHLQTCVSTSRLPGKTKEAIASHAACLSNHASCRLHQSA